MSFDTEDNRRRDGEPARPDPLRRIGEDVRQVQDSAARAIHDLRDQAGAAVEEAKSQTGELASSATARVRGIIEEQKSAGAQALGAMARAAQDAAGQLEERTPMVARAVRQAAAGADRISRDVRERGAGDLANTVADFARREPVAFFAGSVLAGLVLARFVKSSAEAPGVHDDGFDRARRNAGAGDPQLDPAAYGAG